MTRRFALTIAAALVLIQSAAFAQQPGRIRGQIDKVDGAAFVLKTRDGALLNVKLADDVRVSALVKASLADIKPDSFIGIAGVPEADGSIKVSEPDLFAQVVAGHAAGILRTRQEPIRILQYYRSDLLNADCLRWQ